MKTCCTCRETKDLTEFHNNKNSPDSKVKRCKSCVKEACAKSYQTHKEVRTAQARHNYTTNKEHRKAINKRSYEKHKEARLAYSKEWRENNRGLRRAYKEARVEAEAQRTPSWANMDRINGTYKLAKYLSDTYNVDIHVDHEIPLRGVLVSGLHVEDNLQLMYAKDNLSKSNNYEVL